MVATVYLKNINALFHSKTYVSKLKLIFLKSDISLCFPGKTGHIRRSQPEVFLRKGALKIYSKFTAEHPHRSVISIKLQSKSFPAISYK